MGLNVMTRYNEKKMKQKGSETRWGPVREDKLLKFTPRTHTQSLKNLMKDCRKECSGRRAGNWSSRVSGEIEENRGPQRVGHLQILYCTPHIWDLGITVKEALMVRKLARGECRRQQGQTVARIRMGTERPGKPGRGQFPHTLHITIHLSLT